MFYNIKPKGNYANRGMALENDINITNNYYIDKFKNRFNMLFQAEIRERQIFKSDNFNKLTLEKYINGYIESHQDVIISLLNEHGYDIDKIHINSIAQSIDTFNVDKISKSRIDITDKDSVEAYETKVYLFKKYSINNRYIKDKDSLPKDITYKISLFLYTLSSVVSIDKGLITAFNNIILEISSTVLLQELSSNKTEKNETSDTLLDKSNKPDMDKMICSAYEYFIDIVYNIAVDNSIDSYIKDNVDLNEFITKNLMTSCLFEPIKDVIDILPIYIDSKSLEENKYIKYIKVEEINTVEGLRDILKK